VSFLGEDEVDIVLIKGTILEWVLIDHGKEVMKLRYAQ
jgi:hypothetical protein